MTVLSNIPCTVVNDFLFIAKLHGGEKLRYYPLTPQLRRPLCVPHVPQEWPQSTDVSDFDADGNFDIGVPPSLCSYVSQGWSQSTRVDRNVDWDLMLTGL